MIYFAKCEKSTDMLEAGMIKIGTTIRLSERLKQLSKEYGTEVSLIAITDGGRDVEGELHRRFDHLCAAGEWFVPDEELVRFVEERGRPWDGTDEVPAHEKEFISIKCTVAFRDWLATIAAAERSTIAQILEKAAVKYGERRGFKDAPKRTIR